MSALGHTGLVFDHTYSHHDPGPGHPESPSRYTAIGDALRTAGLLDALPRIAARAATDDELLLAHTRPTSTPCVTTSPQA